MNENQETKSTATDTRHCPPSPGSEVSRSDHLEWCKKRALEYCAAHDPQQAYASMASDLNKHPETANHSGLELGMLLLMAGHLSTAEKMAEFIRGFN